MKAGGKDIQVRGRIIRIARLAADKYEYLDDPTATINDLRHAGARVDVFTFMQKLSDPSPRYDYRMEWDNLAAVPVSTFDAWFTKQIDGKTRNMVRRAEKKGVAIREVPFDDELVRGIWGIYNEVPFRQGKPFAHYGKDLDTVRRMSSTFLDRSVFIGAFVNEQLVGFVKLVSDERGEQAALMHILSLVEHRDKSPTNALIAHAVKACADRRIAHLVYSNFAYGNKQRDSLSDFKDSNGFKRFDLPRYYVPLTLMGRAALQLGLHRTAADYIPSSVLERLRKVREAWYVHRFQASRSPS